jgi:putative oxidoreductase
MNTLLRRVAELVLAIQSRLAWLPPAAARVTVGWVFLQSGWGKLHNQEGVVRFFASLGIPAPELQAPLVAWTEFLCGGLLLFGLATRFAALPIIVVMTVALSTALRDRIASASDLFGLAEFCYVVLLVGLVVFGAGPLSLDALVRRRWRALRERIDSMSGSKGAAVAAVVAGLFALGVGAATAAETGAETQKIKCEGVNSCKGHGACKSAANACAGQNGCAGQSFAMLTPEECDAAKAKLKQEKKGS